MYFLFNVNYRELAVNYSRIIFLQIYSIFNLWIISYVSYISYESNLIVGKVKKG